MTSLEKWLAETPVEASAPCRIDSGGTWDIKALALPCIGAAPTTVNIALDIRTCVTLLPYRSGRIKVSSTGFHKAEEAPAERAPFDSPFGMFFAAVVYFGFHGVEVAIDSRAPVKGALGGSSTALVCLVRALDKAVAHVRPASQRMTKGRVLQLAYQLEDGISGGNCGIQDQAAAVYGGVNQWMWRFGGEGAPFRRRPLLDRSGQKALSQRILVAFSGKSHASAKINRKWVHDFLSGRTRSGWMRANEAVHGLAQAIGSRDWKGAAASLRNEMAVRREITPEAVTSLTGALIDEAERAGCGARFAGAGAGGSLWGLGEKARIQGLKHAWEETLRPVRKAAVIECGVDPKGVF